MNYGQKPVEIGVFQITAEEMMFYQDMPIKLANSTELAIEPRLQVFDKLIGAACCDFIGTFGLDKFVESYVYVSAKRLFQAANLSFNRPGWHSDGFMTDDINYIWCDCVPTVFNSSNFNLTQDDCLSMAEMEDQATEENNFTYPDFSLLRLNQYVIHRVGVSDKPLIRTFVKVSVSKDKYDLKGNAKNYLLDYDWEMRERGLNRNVPQKLS